MWHWHVNKFSYDNSSRGMFSRVMHITPVISSNATVVNLTASNTCIIRIYIKVSLEDKLDIKVESNAISWVLWWWWWSIFDIKMSLRVCFFGIY